MSRQNKTEQLIVRMSPKVKRAFTEQADQLELTPSEAIRALVACFLEGRVTIIPPDNR